MIYFKNASKSRREVNLLESLREDLRILENSWINGKLDLKKAIRHLIEIVDSILDIARYESLDPFEAVCVELKTHLMSAAHGKVDFEQRLWRLTSELAGLLRESLDEGTIAFEGLGEWRSRWNAETPAERAEELDPTGEQTGSDMFPHEPANGSASHIQEEDEMPEPRRADPKELLQKAQEALQSGDGAGAKEFALKAAEIIGKLEAEEARKKEKSLRADLEKAMRDAADAEETFRHLKEEITERDRELAIHATRLAEAQSSFDDRQRSSQEIKEQIDKAEAEIAALKEKHKGLLSSYQDTLPARDAVQREVTRARTGADKLQSEIATMRETVNDAESQARQAHQRKQAVETELQKLLQKASG